MANRRLASFRSRALARWFSIVAAALVACAGLAAGAGAARRVTIDTSALRVEQADGGEVLVMPAFVAESDEYTVSGAGGRFDSGAELFVATGSPERPATLARAGESAFSVSAIQTISISFGDEALRAEGGVRYQSDDVEALSDLLVVDRRSRLQPLIDELLQALTTREVRQIVLDFLSRAGEHDRLVVLRGNVKVERADSSLNAGWVLFHEGNAEEFISVADPDRPLRLSVVLEDDAGEPEETP